MDKIIMLTDMSIGDGAILSLVSILMVFAILLIIIGITSLVFKIVRMFEEREKEKNAIVTNEKVSSTPVTKSVEIVDDDMMAAVLVATIDYQSEIKKDVRLISVREVK
ncbi:unknown [Firmicutes bacterium CAG:449]|nr:unknown [Firmicutes bacterium CAG:449]